MSEALIRLRDVGFSYGAGHSVLRGAGCALMPGQRLGLVGANGSGKTTLLHLMVGLLRPSAGDIVAFGKQRRTEADFREVRARAGLLFQDPEDQLFCPTVAEDVAFGPLNLGRSREQARTDMEVILASLGLEGYEDRITYRLSGGEKRLVSLACVLAMKPEALLLDEPVAGLDDETWERLAEILTSLPMAMLIVSHDRRFLRRVADSALLLRGGRLAPWDLADPVEHRP